MPTHVTAELTIDRVAGIATIVFMDNGEPISAWTYAGGVVLMQATPAAVVDMADVLNAKADLDVWSRFIGSTFRPPVWPKSTFDYRIRKTDQGVTWGVSIDDVEIDDHEWAAGSNAISFAERPELELTWADYMLWRDTNERVFETIANFNSGN